MTADDRAPLEGTVYPAGEPVPRPPLLEAVVLPPRPPGPDELPPWRTTTRPKRPRPAPEPESAEPTDGDEGGEGQEAEAPRAEDEPDVVVHVYLPGGGADLTPVDAAPPPWWERALDRLHPWHTAIAAAVALIPNPWTGYSVAATWQSTVWYAHEGYLAAGYGAAAVGVLAAYRLERRVGDGLLRGVLVRAWTICALVGVTGALDLWDPIQIWTGVVR